MENSLKMLPRQLKNRCDYTQFEFETTEQISPLHGFMGQERGRKALQFGLKIKSHGYNIFLTGVSGTGKTSFARKLVREIATEEAAPSDWVYVYNFKYRDKPKALCLPPGWGLRLRDSMHNLMDELKKEVPKVFTGEEYEKLKGKILEDFYAKTNVMYQELEQYARQEDFTIHKTGTGLASVPLINGQPVSEEEYESLSGEVKERIQERNRRVQEKMNETMWRYKELERHTKHVINQLERNLGHGSIGPLIKELKQQFLDFPEVMEYLREVESDLIDSLDVFIDKEEAQGQANLFRRFNRQNIFNRYQVNLLVDNSGARGAPVIEEKNPTFANIFGTVEYEGEFGVLATDFTKIKSGAIHRANGGYLILQAADVLKSFPIWDTLKRSIRNREIVVESIFRNLNLGGAVTLDPQPIPINLKVVLIGEPYLYQLLYVYDEDFRKLFKIKADFDTEIERSREYMEKYAGFISSVCCREHLKHFDRTAVARVVDYSSRLAENQQKLSTLFNKIVEVVVEAAAWAETADADLVALEHVDKALEEKKFRSNRIELKLLEAIREGTLMIDTQGWVVGQVNGLAVYDLGDYAFGKPSRITAKTFMGEKGVINIEREIKLSGQMHSKGVLILMGYLGGMYAQNKPLSLSASLTFEQLYGGVDGDSASSAELFALISSLAGVPISQGIAVTGSVNQQGEIQPVGGINYKIEGFYRVCCDQGLTGKQGVIIPQQNIRNLMLDDAVIEAVQAQRFHIWAIKNVDEGLEILTGVKPGNRLAEGGFTPDTLHFLADQQLAVWGKKSQPSGKNKPEDGEF